MKNKLLIILVVIMLISGILTGISFLIFDRGNVKEYYGNSFGMNMDSWGNGMGHMVRGAIKKEFDRNMKLKHYQELDGFNRVEIQDIEGTVRFYDGNDEYNRIEIYSHNNNRNWSRIEDFKIEASESFDIDVGSSEGVTEEIDLTNYNKKDFPNAKKEILD